jgi:DNA-binding MarR family transcriptional regulator
MSDLIRIYQFRDRDRTYCHGISVSQCYALEAVARHGPLTVNQLAAYLYLGKSTVSRLVEGMVQKELVSRQPHPHDRRSLLVTLTEVGSCVHYRILEEYLERERELLAEFAPEVRPDLIEFIRRLAATATKNATTGPADCG